MKGTFDYVKFATELKDIADSLANHEEDKYEENLKKTSALLENLFESVLRPAMSDSDFLFPTDIKTIARIFNYIYSTFNSPREKLILSLGETLVYETFCGLVDGNNTMEDEQG